MKKHPLYDEIELYPNVSSKDFKERKLYMRKKAQKKDANIYRDKQQKKNSL